MYQLALKTLLLCTIPKAVEETWNYLFGDTPTETPTVKKKKRKAPDYTDITQEHWDWLYNAQQDAHTWNASCKPGQKITQIEIAQAFNREFGTSKSRSAIRRIWAETARDKLPPKQIPAPEVEIVINNSHIR